MCGPQTWGLGEVLATPGRKNASCYEIFTKPRIWTDTWIGVAQDGDRRRALVNVVISLLVP
jgi:hypothetical protein